MKLSTAAAAILVATITFLPATQADEGPVLEAIVVRSDAPLGRGAGAVTEVGEKTLAEREARSAEEALAAVPAVRVSTSPLATSANGKQEVLLSIRGFEATDVKVLVDGVPVEDPYQGVVDLARLPLVAIERLTIARGPTSLLYGPNALGGVVNLVSARPADRLTVRLRSEIDDTTRRRVDGKVSVPVGPVGVLGAVSFSERTGFRVPHGFEGQRNEGGGLRNNSDASDLSAVAKATWRIPGRDGGHRLQVTTHFVDAEGGVPFSVSALEPGTLWRREWQRLQVEAAGLVRPASWFSARGKLFWARFENAISTYDTPALETVALDGAAVSTHLHHGIGAFLNPELRFGRAFKLSGAFNWRIDFLSIEPDSLTDTPSRDYRSEQVSAAVEAELRATGWLKLVAGGSWVGLFKEKAAGAGTGDDLMDWEALLGLRARPWVGAELHIGAARKVGFPRLRQLYGAYGDPDLAPQQAWLFELGLEQVFDWDPATLALRLNAFHDEVSDYIAKHDTGNEVVYRNIAEARLSGVEFGAALDWDGRHSLAVDYTWMRTRDLRKGRVVESLDFRPDHTVDLRAATRFPFGLRVSADLRWTSERRFETPTPAGPEARSFPGRVDLALGLSQTLPFTATADEGADGPVDDRWARVYLRLNNALDALASATDAFDVYHEDAPERPGAGWSLRFGIEAAL